MTQPSDLPRARRVEPPPPTVPVSRRPPPPTPPPAPPSLGPVVVALAGYAGFLALLVTQSVRAVVAFQDGAVQERSRLIRETVALESASAAIVLAALVLCGRPPYYRPSRRLLTWLLAVPLFVLTVGGNITYTLFLRGLVKALGGDIPEPAEGAELDLSIGLWTAVALVCVQPAVVEELFFRHVLMGHLRPHLGMHLSVWVTAVAFGLAHIGAAAAWPVLIVVGAGLGYARALSGGLALPMALHFLHNLAVLHANEWIAK